MEVAVVVEGVVVAVEWRPITFWRLSSSAFSIRLVRLATLVSFPAFFAALSSAFSPSIFSSSFAICTGGRTEVGRR